MLQIYIKTDVINRPKIVTNLAWTGNHKKLAHHILIGALRVNDRIYGLLVFRPVHVKCVPEREKEETSSSAKIAFK